ncbi:hypothetical protein HYH03_009606 [Edaphochlamys debaryana]|uniref:Metallo-beta-lactamase domain-containing protein n=1 Tax=Edaphochlamys debaryana TaxID=47281 RepID=A0A836BX28_9CHLO|nr:hypothetical protein HYH03_009606 [Edaphochlamys debaryana]|eukprot:KAG2492115.1 hypothetical protein HYH03_009606 [Edaphochlamys debaryana]
MPRPTSSRPCGGVARRGRPARVVAEGREAPPSEQSSVRPRLRRAAPATTPAPGQPSTSASARPLSPAAGRLPRFQSPADQPSHQRPASALAPQQGPRRPAQGASLAPGTGLRRAQEPAGPDLKTGLAVTFLGTNSGTPTLERNVSCTLVRLPGAVHLVDCGEGSHRQLLALPGLDLAQVDCIFVTHLHGDHCFGLGAALQLLDGHKPEGALHRVCGPPGVAELLRASLLLTGLASRLRLPVEITELVCSPSSAHPPRPLTAPGAPAGAAGAAGAKVTVQRLAARKVASAPDLTTAVAAVGPRVAALEEIWWPPRSNDFQPGSNRSRFGGGGGYSGGASDSEADLYSSMDEDMDHMSVNGNTYGRRQYVAAEGLYWEIPNCSGVRVRAAQLQHRVPCWGYVFTEAVPYEEGAKRRKAVVLGDTVSSRAIAPLAAGCDVMSHEATFAQGMEQKARVAQHSTGWMAGAFAAAIGARHLVLTHFSARYQDAPRRHDDRPTKVSTEEEAQEQSWAVAGLLREAGETYKRPGRIFAASDYYTFHVPLRSATANEPTANGRAAGADGSGSDDEGSGHGPVRRAAPGGLRVGAGVASRAAVMRGEEEEAGSAAGGRLAPRRRLVRG